MHRPTVQARRIILHKVAADAPADAQIFMATKTMIASAANKSNPAGKIQDGEVYGASIQEGKLHLLIVYINSPNNLNLILISRSKDRAKANDTNYKHHYTSRNPYP